MTSLKSESMLTKLNNKIQSYLQKNNSYTSRLFPDGYPSICVGDTFRGSYPDNRYIQGGFWKYSQDIYLQLLDIDGKYYLVQTDKNYNPLRTPDAADCIENSSANDLFEWFISDDMILRHN